MAFSSQWRRLRIAADAAATPLAEINVTPFVDVVLVLLIIFMLTAHVMEFGIEVDVPKVRTVKESAQRSAGHHAFTKDGITYLGRQADQH